MRTCLPAVVILGLAGASSSCGVERREPFDGDPAFRMSQPARLYFANVRSSNYYHERPPGTSLDLYRLKAISQTTQRPMVYPVIVQATLRDEAYVFVRTNDFPGFGDPPLVERVAAGTPGDQPDTLSGGTGTRPEQRAFADSLRVAIVRGDGLYVRLADGTRAAILDDRATRQQFLTVMGDYRRLIERGGAAPAE